MPHEGKSAKEEIHVWVPPEDKKEFKRRSKEAKRSLSEFCADILHDYLTKRPSEAPLTKQDVLDIVNENNERMGGKFKAMVKETVNEELAEAMRVAHSNVPSWCPGKTEEKKDQL